MLKGLLGVLGRESTQKNKEEPMVPLIDADDAIWKNFLEKADWQTKLKAYQQFVMRGQAHKEHDEKIRQMIWGSLFEIVLPVLPKSFLTENANLILSVKDNATDDEVLDIVFNCHREILGPKYVVEKGGKLRGFAITSDLILLGVTPVYGYSRDVRKYVQGQRFSLLTEDDSRIVKRFIPKLDRLMKKARVPSLNHVAYWLIDNSKSQHYCYFSSNDTYNAAVTTLGVEGYSVLVAKL